MITRRLRVLLTVSLFFVVYGLAQASGSGETGRTSPSFGCGGNGCHAGSLSTATSVTFTSGNGSFTVAPGGKLEITVIVAHPSQAAAGIDVGVKTTKTSSTNVGALSTSDNGARISNSELTHNSPKTMTGGKAEFTFTWTAPATEGTYFLRAVGNAVNRNGDADGSDLWNFATPVELVVKKTNGVDESSNEPSLSLGVYPNPSADHAVITYDLASLSGATIEITDLIGRSFIKQAVDNSSGNVDVSLLALPVGIYQVVLRSRDIQKVQRLIIAR